MEKVYWDVRRHMAKRGWTAYELSKRAEIREATAYEIRDHEASGAEVKRIPSDILLRMAKALRVSPWSLLRIAE